MPLPYRQRTMGLRDAAAGVGMLAAVVAPGAADAQQVAASATPSAPAAGAVEPAKRPIPQEHCDALYDAVIHKVKIYPEGTTLTAKAGMRSFFVNASTGKIDCSGERQWSWGTLRDTDFNNVVIRDGSAVASIRCKCDVDFYRDYGVRSASRPSKVPPAVGPSSQARPAPRG